MWRADGYQERPLWKIHGVFKIAKGTPDALDNDRSEMPAVRPGRVGEKENQRRQDLLQLLAVPGMQIRNLGRTARAPLPQVRRAIDGERGYGQMRTR